MLSIIDFVNYIKTITPNTPVFPFAFPVSKEKGIMVELGNGFNSRGTVNEITLTITIRDIHPNQSEIIAQTINSALLNKTDLYIKDYQIILIKPLQLLPNYLGKDESGFYYYLLNFKMLIS